jgi:hypothetical protein
MVLVVLSFRSCFLDGTCIDSMHQETSRSGLSPTISFLRTMLLLSMTYPTIIVTSYLRFQFKTQLLFQVAHLALIVVCSSAGAHPGCCVCVLAASTVLPGVSCWIALLHAVIAITLICIRISAGQLPLRARRSLWSSNFSACLVPRIALIAAVPPRRLQLRGCGRWPWARPS